MKKIVVSMLALVFMSGLLHAEMKCAAGKCGTAMKSPAQPKKMMKMFQSVSKDKATLLQDGKAKAFCPACGMRLPMFFKTNHVAKVEGKVKQYCSIHCVVEEMQKGKKLEHIQVVDTHSLKLIDAHKAIYVVGSSKKGTMTAVSKYAFSAKAAFVKDSKIIAKKQAMMSKKGKMMYSKMCQKTENTFVSTAEAKAYILSHDLCKGLNGKQLQAVGLYLKNR